ncbi:unnamed protein product [Calicophoron daubneyi]|uniref:Cilia- and flagella-associated protein 157 n=1 Tax=Calicophoron daubneyi TaxID=300641 RepID=A0AAV2TWD8_CALDB
MADRVSTRVLKLKLCVQCRLARVVLLIRANLNLHGPPKGKKSGGRSGRRTAASVGSFSLPQDLDEDAIASLGRDYYLLLVRQMEEQVKKLDDYCRDLQDEYQSLTERDFNADWKKCEALRDLSETFQEKIFEYANLLERIRGKYAWFMVEKDRWAKREMELKMHKERVEEQMKAENQALTDELNALEEFKANKEALCSQYRDLETQLEMLRTDHVKALEGLEIRDVGYRGRLKRAAARKLNEKYGEKCSRRNRQLARLRGRTQWRKNFVAELSDKIFRGAEIVKKLITDDLRSNDDNVTSKVTDEAINSILKILTEDMDSIDDGDDSEYYTSEHEDTEDPSDHLVLPVVLDEDDKDSSSGISYPHSDFEDNSLEISEPENSEDEGLPSMEMNSVGSRECDQNCIPVEEELQSKSAEMEKAPTGRTLCKLERLDDLWSEVQCSKLQLYRPSSKEWHNVLNFLVNSVGSFVPNLKSGGYLKSGDLELVPPPSAVIPTKLQIRHAEQSGRKRMTTDNSHMKQNVNRDAKTIYVAGKLLNALSKPSSASAIVVLKNLGGMRGNKCAPAKLVTTPLWLGSLNDFPAVQLRSKSIVIVIAVENGAYGATKREADVSQLTERDVQRMGIVSHKLAGSSTLVLRVEDLDDLFSSEEEDFVSQPKRPRGVRTNLSNIPGRRNRAENQCKGVQVSIAKKFRKKAVQCRHLHALALVLRSVSTTGRKEITVITPGNSLPEAVKGNIFRPADGFSFSRSAVKQLNSLPSFHHVCHPPVYYLSECQSAGCTDQQLIDITPLTRIHTLAVFQARPHDRFHIYGGTNRTRAVGCELKMEHLWLPKMTWLFSSGVCELTIIPEGLFVSSERAVGGELLAMAATNLTLLEVPESSYYANINNPALPGEAETSNAFHMGNADYTASVENQCMRNRIESVEERIRGNIDALDYLRGISKLEKGFANVVEDVLHTALVLSRENIVNYPHFVCNEQMDKKVDRCWNYIAQLTEVVQYHVAHAVRYHKFHYELRSAEMKLEALRNLLAEKMSEVEKSSLLTMDQLDETDQAVQIFLVKLKDLASIARNICIQARSVPPLHLRKQLPEGQHSAQVLASMRLPNGGWVHRGESVKVWANSKLAELHHEWRVQTLDEKITTTLPSLCLWLASPEGSPLSSLREKQKHGVTAGQSVGEAGKEFLVKPKGKDSIFNNNKLAAERFQSGLFTTWIDLIGDLAQLLLPTFRKYAQYLESIENEIPVHDKKEIDLLLNQLEPLMEYGNSEDLVLLQELKSKPTILLAEDPAITKSDLHTLNRTLDSWNELCEQLKEAKKLSSVRPDHEEELAIPQEHTDGAFTRNIHGAQMFPKVSAVISEAKPSEQTLNEEEELITSFTEPAPQTYRVNVDEENSSPTRSRSQIDETVDHCQPFQAGLGKHDLMTQIITPYIPTLVTCPKCNSEYEVNVYSSSWELNAGEGLTATGDVHYLTERERPLDHPLRTSDSMPTLSMLPDTTQDTTETVRSSHSVMKVFRKMRKLSKHRAHSFSNGAGETSGTSSGFESSPGTMTNPPKKEGTRQKCEISKKFSRSKAGQGRIPFFRWGKRSKQRSESVSPESEIVETERQSPLNFGRLKYSSENPSTHTDQSCASIRVGEDTGPIVRSRSWIQQGTPWGYGPSHEICYPANWRLQPAHVQSHSDRVRLSAARPKATDRICYTADSQRLFSAEEREYNTVDSGIQTDTDMGAASSDLLKGGQAEDSIETVKLASQVYKTDLPEQVRHDYAIQESLAYLKMDRQMDTEKTITPELPSSRLSALSSVACQTVGTFRVNMEHDSRWDASCQIGTIQRSQSVCAINNESLTDQYCALSDNRESSVHPSGERNSRPQSEMARPTVDYCSVSCQIGYLTTNAATSPDISEAVKLLDETIQRSGRTADDTKSTSSCLMGKKLQVGKPWWQDQETKKNIEYADTATSPIPGYSLNDIQLSTANGLKGNTPQVSTPLKSHDFESTVIPTESLCVSLTNPVATDVSKPCSVSILCSPVMGHVEVLSRKSNVSTMIGRCTSTKEQQTPLSLLQPDLRSVILQTSVVQMGYTPSPLLVDKDEEYSPTCVSGPLNASEEEQAKTTVKELCATSPSERLSPQLEPLDHTDSERCCSQANSVSCPKCGYHFTVPHTSQESVIKTRSKRIQKGSPKLSHKHGDGRSKQVGLHVGESSESATGEAPLAVKRNEPRDQKSKRAKSAIGYKQHRLVVDIGLFEDKIIRDEDGCRRVASRPVYCCPEQLRSDTESEFTTSSSNSFGGCTGGDSDNAVHMSFCLDGRCHHRPPEHKLAERYRPYVRKSRRTVSVDDIRIPSPGNSPPIVKGSPVAKHTTDQTKQKNEFYHYL